MTKIRVAIFLNLFSLAACTGNTFPEEATDGSSLNDETQTYTGAGTVFDPQGRVEVEYTVDLTRTPLPEGGFAIDVTVAVPDGSTHEIHTTMIPDEGNGFAIESDTSRGGGLDLGEGLITTYTVDDDGTSYASTLAIDDDGMRVVRYELVDGQAVRIFREAYDLVADVI